MSSYLLSALKENTIPPSEFRSSKGILSQTLGKQSPYSTLGLRPRVEYENSLPRVWERILILLPPSEGGMYYSQNLSPETESSPVTCNSVTYLYLLPLLQVAYTVVVGSLQGF